MSSWLLSLSCPTTAIRVFLLSLHVELLPHKPLSHSADPSRKWDAGMQRPPPPTSLPQSGRQAKLLGSLPPPPVGSLILHLSHPGRCLCSCWKPIANLPCLCHRLKDGLSYCVSPWNRISSLTPLPPGKVSSWPQIRNKHLTTSLCLRWANRLSYHVSPYIRSPTSHLSHLRRCHHLVIDL